MPIREDSAMAEDKPMLPKKKRGILHSKLFWIALLVIVVAAAAFAGGWWVTTSGTRATASLLDSYTAVYAGTDSTKDVVDLMPLYASDATLEDIPQDRTYVGTEEVKAAFDALFATLDFDLTIEDTKVGSGWALVSWTADGTRPGTSRLTQASGVTLLEVDDGAIVRETWYYDPAKAPF